VAVAGRVAVLPDLGLAVRGEYVREHDSANHGALIISHDPGNVGGPAHTVDIWSLTGTVDYALTSHLKVKNELRWDRANGSGDGDTNNQFAENSPGDFQSNDQLVWLIAAEYIF